MVKALGFNWWLLATTLAVAGTGLLNLGSVTVTSESNLALVQGLWQALGLVLALVVALIDYRLLERLAYPLWLVNLLLLGLVLVTGRTIYGSQRWLHLGPVNFQPSEMSKLVLILCLAKYFNDEDSWPQRGYRLLDIVKPASIFYPLGSFGGLLLFWEKLPFSAVIKFVLLGACLFWAAASFLLAERSGRLRLHDHLSPIILLGTPVALIMRQPDLGTSLVLCAICASCLLFVKIRPLSLMLGGVLLVALAMAAWFFVLEDYQKKRVFSFLEPEENIKSSGYHAWQSRIAVGSGGTQGKGYRQSTQTRFRFLPEQHTDFVFSVWAEEWGFRGCMAALMLFFFWQFQMLLVAANCRERFGQLAAVGILSMVFWHVLVNIGMVIGLLPVVGITLPLWSYGGSSLLFFWMGVGVLLSIWSRRLVV